jgi:hypothetical protein
MSPDKKAEANCSVSSSATDAEVWRRARVVSRDVWRVIS